MFAFFESLSCWDWMDLFGLLMVLLGVVGEVWSAKKHNESWETRWGAVLIIGLGLELAALPHHFKEAGELRDLAAKANERASTNELRAAITESNNLVLRLELAAIELKLQPRTITDSEIASFVAAAKDEPKKSVWILHSGASEDAAPLALRMRQMLDAAGYGATGSEPSGIFGWSGGGVIVNSGATIEMKEAPGALALIWVNADDFRPGKVPPVADALERAFVAAGITALVQPVNALKSGDVLVAIPNRKRF